MLRAWSEPRLVQDFEKRVEALGRNATMIRYLRVLHAAIHLLGSGISVISFLAFAAIIVGGGAAAKTAVGLMVLGLGVCEFLCACESSVLALDFENLGFEPSAFGPSGLLGSCEKRLLRCGARIVRMAGEPQELCRDLNLQIFHLQTLSSEQMPDTPNLCLTSQRPNTTIHAQFQSCTNRELQREAWQAKQSICMLNRLGSGDHLSNVHLGLWRLKQSKY